MSARVIPLARSPRARLVLLLAEAADALKGARRMHGPGQEERALALVASAGQLLGDAERLDRWASLEQRAILLLLASELEALDRNLKPGNLELDDSAEQIPFDRHRPRKRA